MSLEDNQTADTSAATGATSSEPVVSTEPTERVETTHPAEPAVGSKEAGLAAAKAAFDKHLDTPKGTATGAISDKARGPDGKFAPKAGDATQAVDPTEPITATGANGDPQKPLAVDVPNYLPARIREDWAKAPESVRQYHQQREAQAHDQISHQGRQIAALRPLAEATTAYSDYFQRDGVDPATGIRNAMEWVGLAQKDPATFLRSFAERNSIDLVSLITDPETHQQRSQQTFLEQRLESMERELRARDAQAAQQQNYQQEQQISSLTNTVESFAASAPDFDLLSPQITALIPAIRAASPHLSQVDILKDAYERARWADPVTRNKLEAERKAADDRNRIEAQKKAAAAARSASAINVTSAPGNSPAIYADAKAAAAAAWERGMSK